MRIRTMIMGPGKGKGKGIMQQMSKMGGKHGNMNPQNVQQMARMLPPQVCCLPLCILHANAALKVMLPCAASSLVR